MKLRDMVEVYENNADCVVLKVKEGQRMALISLGCFDGDEELFRLTKGGTVTCTVWKEDGKSVSWHWGSTGYTLVSPVMKKRGELIEECIEKDFGIECQVW